MSGFHEVRFPDNIAYGATGGPEFATTVVATSAGHEKRNVNWAEARGRWDVASGLKKQAQIDELIAFFRARRGKAYGFRFKDWTDYKATGQLLGTGDGFQTQFQLVKHYPSGSAPALGTAVPADFEFDVPVRFDPDHMAVTIESYRLHNWQQIPIVELRI